MSHQTLVCRSEQDRPRLDKRSDDPGPRGWSRGPPVLDPLQLQRVAHPARAWSVPPGQLAWAGGTGTPSSLRLRHLCTFAHRQTHQRGVTDHDADPVIAAPLNGSLQGNVSSYPEILDESTQDVDVGVNAMYVLVNSCSQIEHRVFGCLRWPAVRTCSSCPQSHQPHRIVGRTIKE